jgi:hypothetical protein
LREQAIVSFRKTKSSQKEDINPPGNPQSEWGEGISYRTCPPDTAGGGRSFVSVRPDGPTGYRCIESISSRNSIAGGSAASSLTFPNKSFRYGVEA